MIKQVDFLEVKHRDIPVGRLVLNKENIALFEYDKTWLSNGFSISPIVLPLAPKTFKSKQNPFNWRDRI